MDMNGLNGHKAVVLGGIALHNKIPSGRSGNHKPDFRSINFDDCAYRCPAHLQLVSLALSIIAFGLESVEIGFIDITSHIFTVET